MSRDAFFNKKTTYKDRLQERKDASKYVVLDKINEKNILKVNKNIQHQ